METIIFSVANSSKSDWNHIGWAAQQNVYCVTPCYVYKENFLSYQSAGFCEHCLSVKKTHAEFCVTTLTSASILYENLAL